VRAEYRPIYSRIAVVEGKGKLPGESPLPTGLGISAHLKGKLSDSAVAIDCWLESVDCFFIFVVPPLV
jgi:hypothetical protein